MKHNLKIIGLMVLLYILAQYIGLFVTSVYLEEALPYNIERPEFDETYSFAQLFLIILLVTCLVYLIMRYRTRVLWKLWFFLSIWFTVMLSLGSFMLSQFALIMGFVAAWFKVFRKDLLVNNVIELFVYGGLAAIFVPVLTIKSISILLIVISIYDMIAVWKTKHMISLAKFQTESGLFPGLVIRSTKGRVAILGGGDIGFPLLFTGVIFSSYGLVSLVLPLVIGLSLFLLFYYGKKTEYYPAMPFLTIGCFVGFGLVRFLSLVL